MYRDEVGGGSLGWASGCHTDTRDLAKSDHLECSLTDSFLTESSFSSEFTTPRSMSGSNLKYDFPSPMHAILLHYHKMDDMTNAKTPSDIGGNVANESLPVDESEVQPQRRRASFGDAIRRPRSRKAYELPAPGGNKDAPSSEKIRVSDDNPPATHTSDDNKVHSVSAYMKILMNRGLTKKRQDERERRQRMIGALEQLNTSDTFNFLDGPSTPKQAEEQTADKRVEALVSRSKEDVEQFTSIHRLRRDKSESTPSVGPSPVTDHDSGHWDDSLSSIGKKGSRVSIRSSTSSKASLSSEEGYYSHPGSPQHKHSNSRFSIQSSTSFNSAGSVSFLQSECSDEDAMDSPYSGIPDKESVAVFDSVKDISSALGIVEIIELTDSPGCRRRRQSCSKSASYDANTCNERSRSGEEMTKHTGKGSDLKTFVSPPSPRMKLDFEALDAESSSKSAKSLAPNPVKQPLEVLRHSPKSPRLAVSNLDVPTSPGRRKHSDSTSWGKILPDAPRLPALRHTSPKHDSPRGVEKDQQKSPTAQKMSGGVSEEVRPGTLTLSTSLLVKDVPVLEPLPICDAPKIPSWRTRKKGVASRDGNTLGADTSESVTRIEKSVSLSMGSVTQATSALIRKMSEVGNLTHRGQSAFQRETALSVGNQAFSGERLQKDTQSQERELKSDFTSDKQSVAQTVIQGEPQICKKQAGHQRECIQRRASDSNSPASGMVNGANKTDSGLITIKKPDGGSQTPTLKPDPSNVFQYPPQEMCMEGHLKTPSLKDIPEILQSWMEARTPTLPKSGSPDSAESKSFTLPRGHRLQDPVGGYQTRVDPHTHSHPLQMSKRMFHSQELYPKGARTLSVKPRTVIQSFRPYFTTVQSREQGKTTTTTKDSNVPSPKSPAPQIEAFSRPRAHSWTRGQNPMTLPRNTKTCWVREVSVPPSRSYRRPVLGDSTNTSGIQTRMQWYRPSAEIQDTFV